MATSKTKRHRGAMTMAKRNRREDEYHQQFAERIIKALEAGTAPWQPRKPGERILPHNFGNGRDYRGGNAVYLAMNALGARVRRPALGRYRQIQEAGGHVRNGEKGTPILYVDFNRRETVRDEGGKPVLDDEGHPVVESVKRDRTLVKLQIRLQRRAARGVRPAVGSRLRRRPGKGTSGPRR